MKDPPRGHCQERVTDISLAGSYYRQCPTATEDDSGRRGNCYSRREGGHDRLVGDWTVPDQFGFTFRVELRMTVIDRHQGHASFSTVSIDECNLVSCVPLEAWAWAQARNTWPSVRFERATSHTLHFRSTDITVSTSAFFKFFRLVVR